MTAHPLDHESRRRPVYAAVALVLVMVAVLLAAECIGDGKNIPVADNETVAITLTSSILQTTAHRDIVNSNNSIAANPVSRNTSCPNTPYEPIFLLGDNNTTRILGHEMKSVNTSRMVCTEFDPNTYTISLNLIPFHVMKYDFAELNQTQIYSKIRQDQEIAIWIRGQKYRALFKEMNFNAEDIGIYSYHGVLDGVPQSEILITIDKNTTIGSVKKGDDTFYFEPVGVRKGTAGNRFPVNIIYAQKDVEDYSFSLANDVVTPPITVVHYEST